MVIRVLIGLFFILNVLICYSQKHYTNEFNFYEIKVFSGLTINGTHSLTLDVNGLVLKKNELYENEGKYEIVNFKELNGKELKTYRKNFKEFLNYMSSFDYKDYQPLKSKHDTIITDGDTTIREHIISSHDLGTRILVIDKDYKSYFFRYLFCEEALEKLIVLINNLIPERVRAEYKFQERCH